MSETSLGKTLLEHSALVPLLFAAAELGVLSSLEEGGTSEAELGRGGVDPRAARLLIDVLVAYDLAARHGDGRLHATPALLELQAAFPGGISIHARLTSHLPAFLRSGTAAFSAIDDPHQRPAFYAGMVAPISALWRREAETLADSLAEQLERERPGARMEPLRFLDAGCGAGVWGLTLLARFPNATLVGFDLPLVVPAFAQAAESAGLAARVVSAAGDLFQDRPPRNFDLVLVANVLRLEDSACAEWLVQRLAGALAPGGRLVVVDALAGGNPAADRRRALYAVNLALRSERGTVHSPADVRRFLERADLIDVESTALPLGSGALGALSARRPTP